MPLRKFRLISEQSLNIKGYVYPYGIIATNAFLLWKEGITGKNVNVAIIDSGIAAHSDLNLNIVHRTSFTGGIVNYHGTHVAGIIAANPNDGNGVYGMAPDARLYDLQILNAEGGSEGDFLKAVELAVQLGVDIINASVGSTEDDPRLRKGIDLAKKENILVVCASGNEGNNSIVYPGSYPWSVSVANWDIRTLKISPTSTSNLQVDICANGVNVISTERNGGYAVYSGTSMAAPIITGLLALYIQKIRLEKPHLSKQDIARMAKDMLYSNVVDLDPKGIDIYSGHGEAKYNPSSKESFNGTLINSLYYQ